MSCHKMLSVFSGAMGLDVGLVNAGFQSHLAADLMSAAVETIRRNIPGLPVVDQDLSSVSGSELVLRAGLEAGEVDLLAGGPPCQSFSTAGRRRGRDDARTSLVFEFVRLVEEIRPRAFLMENVKGLLSASLEWRQLPYNNNGVVIDEHHGSLFRKLWSEFEAIGYTIDARELNAAEYGVPQLRKRVFVMGYRDGQVPNWPQPSHSSAGGLFSQQYATVRDAIGDLHEIEPIFKQFSPRKLAYLQMIPQGGNWRDLPVRLQQESMGKAFAAKGGRTGYWRRLSFDNPSPTILTEPNNASTSLCHPELDRPLSVRECARIQTFPDSWEFYGSVAEQYRLIGNAVPPLLAMRVGEVIAATLKKKVVGRSPAKITIG